MKRQSVISVWYDWRITVGFEFENAIDRNVENADVILLLVGPLHQLKLLL
jgi:hypothetical protein